MTKTAPSNPALLPCPFCGGEARCHKTDVSPGYQTSSVSCKKCPARLDKSKLDADVFWNTRTPAAPRTEAQVKLVADVQVEAAAKAMFLYDWNRREVGEKQWNEGYRFIDGGNSIELARAALEAAFKESIWFKNRYAKTMMDNFDQGKMP